MSDLTNLLPTERQWELRRAYWYRLATLAIIVLTLLIIVNGLLLLPTYTYLKTEVGSRTAHLAELDRSLSSANEQQLASRLALLGAQTASLASLATSTPQSGVLTEVLAIVHPGVQITGLTLTPPHAKMPESVTLTGIAATRDALRTYYLALSGASFVDSINLPVSAYAIATNAPFTVTLTLP